MQTANLIHGMTLDVTYDGDVETSESLADWLRMALLPVVDTVLAQQDRAGQVRRIERLEIDLGSVPREEAADELAKRLTEQLASALDWSQPQSPPLLPTSAPIDAMVADADWRQASEQLQNFLRSGRLPWSVAADPHTAHECLLERVLVAPKASEVLAEVVQDHHMLVRLIRQFNTGLLAQVAEVLHPHQPAARRDGDEAYWQAVLQGVTPAQPAEPAPQQDAALEQFRDWRVRNGALPSQLAELHQWLIWWLMHDSSMLNQDCSLMLESIAAQCAEVRDPAQFMRLVLNTLRSGGQLDLEEMARQSASLASLAPSAAMDAITTLKSQQAIRNFVDQQMAEDRRLGSLNSAQLHQLVRAWINDPSSVFLAALESYALQAVDAHGYFQQILQSLLKDQPIDLEALCAPADVAPAAAAAAALAATAVPPAATAPIAASAATPVTPAAESAATPVARAAASTVTTAATSTITTDAATAATAASTRATTPTATAVARGAENSRARERQSPLPALLQQGLPQRLATAMLQADLSSLEVIWPEITRYHADVLNAAVQRYLRRPQERANLIARASPEMLIAMLKAISPAAGQLVEPILQQAERCGAVLSPSLQADEVKQRVLNFAFRQVLAEEGIALDSLLQALLPEQSTPEEVREAGHAWRAILPSMRALDRMLFGDRYLLTIEQRLQDDDSGGFTLVAMLATELWLNFPELVDAPLRGRLMAADIALPTAAADDQQVGDLATDASPAADGRMAEIAVVAGHVAKDVDAKSCSTVASDIQVDDSVAEIVSAVTATATATVASAVGIAVADAIVDVAATSISAADERTSVDRVATVGIGAADMQSSVDGSEAASSVGSVAAAPAEARIDAVAAGATAGVAAIGMSPADGRASEHDVVVSDAVASVPAPVEAAAGVIAAGVAVGVATIDISSKGETASVGGVVAASDAATATVSATTVAVSVEVDGRRADTGAAAANLAENVTFTAVDGGVAGSAAGHAAVADAELHAAGLDGEAVSSALASGLTALAEAAAHRDADGIPPASAHHERTARSGQAVDASGKRIGGLALKTALAAEAALSVLLMRAEPLGRTEQLAAELTLQRILRAENIPLSGALETALSQPSAIDRLVEIAPAPVLAQLLTQLQPELAIQLPSVLSAIARSIAVVNIPAMQSKAHWRIIYQTAFVTADPVTPAEFIRNLIHNLGGKSDAVLPLVQPAAPTRQAAMQALLQPLPSRSASQPANQALPQQQAEPTPFTGESNIRNAGMVIIATYAQRLFSILELTKDGQFISDEAAQRAVHLLQYAITGATTTPEYQLVLNKLLCGIHGGQPITRGIDITDKEKDTIEQMLNGVIAHWKALGKTSIAGLRQTFLQREGHLYFEEEAWHLNIPTATFDMLLDRLPWSFAMIRFPWMEHPLHVTWR